MTMENTSWEKALWGTVGVSYESDSGLPHQSQQKNSEKKSDDKGTVNHSTQLFGLIGINLVL